MGKGLAKTSMIEEELATYLRLTPEFGGTRFGPFEDLEVRLGSDPDRCHIVLQPELGVQPEHVKLFRQGQDSLILAPSDRTASVFLFRMNSGSPTHVSTPTAVQAGDAFALVTTGGPRFIIELDELPEEVKEQREAARGGGGKTGRKRLSKDAMAGEAKRQAFTTLLVTGPAQMAQRAFTFVKSGAIFMPRNILLGLAMCGGWIFGGVSMCRSRGVQQKLVTTNQRYENCDQELSFAKNLSGDSTDYSFEQLAARIVQSTLLGEAMEQDDALRSMVKKKSKTIFANAKQYRWIVGNQGAKAARFAEWRERVMGEDNLDEDTRRLLVWLAGHSGRLNSEFEDISDSEGDEVCGRGPLKMTYRQALSLGLTPQPDAFVARDYERIRENGDERERLLIDTVAAAGGAGLPEDNYSTELDPVRQGRSACLYIEGGDDRTRPASIVSTFSRQLGEEPEDLPPLGAPTSSVARLAKYWAADMMRVDYRGDNPGISFSDAQVGATLDGFDARGQWVLSRTAETIARSVVIPCLAVLQGKPDDAKNTLGDQLPSPVNCLVLDWKLRNPD
jgi:hypothetical protein